MSGISPRFLDPLVLEEVDACRWQLVHELRYDSAILGARVCVPVGRLTDLASVPRLPFAYWLTGDTGRKAGVIHDEVYHWHMGGASRAMADAIFHEALLAEGIVPWRAALMYAGVRLGGWASW